MDDKKRLELLQNAKPEGSSQRGLDLDRRWSAGEDGTVRGWLRGGRMVEILPSGAVVESPYQFLHAAASGAFAFARADGSRAFQTTDHGRSWVEVAAPAPLLGRSFQQHGCTLVGCDLGAWLRLGWEAPPPSPTPPPAIAAPPPALPTLDLRTMACRPGAEVRQAAAPLTPASSMDHGLGARVVPVTGDLLPGRGEQAVSYVRQVFSRALINPPHSYYSDDEQAPRAMLHGFAMEVRGWDAPRAADPLAGLVVLGPSPGPRGFRRDLTFLEPLDPAGSIRTVSFGVAALLAVLRGTGAPAADALTGPLELIGLAPVLPLDPAGPIELFFALTPLDTGGIVGVTRGAAADLGWAAEMNGSPVSAVALPGAGPGAGGIATLWIDDAGAVSVHRLSGGTLTRIGGLPAPPTGYHYPANPDALAIGPQSDLWILRAPSGSEPPSAEDPALLFPLAGGPPRALAPWSTLASAADPVCRDAPGGYRAIVQSVRPWLRAGPSRPPDEALTPMTARVRWSEARVCLEAIEVPVGMAAAPGGTSALEAVIVARFAGAAGAGEITVGLGVERRQAIACTLEPAGARAGAPRP
jgi:hypothetical protein